MRKDIIAIPFLTYYGIIGLIYGFLLMRAMQITYTQPILGIITSILIVASAFLSLQLAIAIILNMDRRIK
ncbi:MAG: hypothetical protein NZ879_07280, partial [Archaeoglobaceae archaeon]|nr:hypothetical protein [Archaeoglobaceae archaeon]MDW8118767.1 hypothetical protein [Archaeoglobaceae archaeon]